jgi:hypothetical protein
MSFITRIVAAAKVPLKQRKVRKTKERLRLAELDLKKQMDIFTGKRP